jgi:hypothetical protein
VHSLKPSLTVSFLAAECTVCCREKPIIMVVSIPPAATIHYRIQGYYRAVVDESFVLKQSPMTGAWSRVINIMTWDNKGILLIGGVVNLHCLLYVCKKGTLIHPPFCYYVYHGIHGSRKLYEADLRDVQHTTIQCVK